MWTKALNILLAVVVVAVGVLADVRAAFADPWIHPAQLLNNPGFQTGDLTGWTGSYHNAPPSQGDGTAQGNLITVNSKYHSSFTDVYPPVGNTYFAMLTAGDYLQAPTTLSQAFTVTDAGQYVTGWAYFGAWEQRSYNDYGVISIRNNSTGLKTTVWSKKVSDVGGGGNSGWQSWYHTFLTAGSYTLLAQVYNVGDSNASSVLGVSAFCTEVPTSNAIHLSVNHIGAGSGTTSVIQNGNVVTPNLNNLTGYYFDPGSIIQAVAAPDTGNYFASWSDLYGNFLSVNDALNVDFSDPLAPTLLQADFEPIPDGAFYLHTSVSGNGSVLAMVDGLPVDLGQYPFTAISDDVVLQAIPDSGWIFNGWDTTATDIGTVNSLDNTMLNISMKDKTGDMTVNVDFSTGYSLTANILDQSGTNNSDAGKVEIYQNINNGGYVPVATGITSFASGAQLQLIAQPSPDYAFAGWSGVDSTDSSDNTIAYLTMNSDRTISATFNQAYSLSVGTLGNGTVTISQKIGGTFQPIDPTGAAFVPGTEFLIQATASSGSYFAGWQGSLPPGAGPLSNPLDFQISGDTFLDANFTLNNFTDRISSSANSTTYGQAVTFTAVLTAASSSLPAPTGALQFLADGNSLGSPVNLVNGSATTPAIATLSAGTHTITAFYNGDSTYGSGPLTSQATLQVNPADTSLVLTSSDNPSNYGDAVTFTAAVSTASGAALTGSVTFTDQTATLGTIALSNNTAVLNIAALNVGVHPISAQYVDSTGNFNSSHAGLTQTVKMLTPEFNDLESPTISQGAAVTELGGFISAEDHIPTGNIAITLNGVTQSAAILPDGSFVYSFNTSAFQTNSYPITYAYAGDTNFNGITGSGTLTVDNKITPAITWSNPAAITFGTALSSLQLNAIATVDNSAIEGTYVYSPGTGAVLNPGTNNLWVAFVPKDTADYNTASARVQILVVQAATSTTLTATPNPSTYGQAVKLTASVSIVSPGAGTLSGSVLFTDQTNNITLGTVPLNGNTAIFNTTALSVGNHTLTAAYTDIHPATFNGSSATASQMVGKVTPSFSNLSSPLIYSGTAFTQLSGFIKAGAYLPTGSVAITLNGVTQLAQIQADGSFAVSFDTGSFTANTYNITYVYAGDANSNGINGRGTLTVNDKTTPAITWSNPAAITYGTALGSLQLNAVVNPSNIDGALVYSPATGSVLDAGTQVLSVTFTPADTNQYNTVSKAVEIVVNPANTTISLTSTPNPSAYKKTVTLTANVSIVSPGAGTLYGSVLFTDQNHNNAVLGQIYLVGHTAVLSTSALSAGSHNIVATYADNTPNFNGSNTNLTQQVGPWNPVFTNLSSQPIYVGTPSNPISGFIKDGNFIPSGNVGIKLNGVTQNATIQSDGSFTSTFNTGALAVGTYTVTYTYAGDASSNGATGSGTQIVNNKLDPVITWSNPAAIIYGTALSGTQLNATANIPGNFIYNPAAGAIPGAGTQVLSVTFNPTNSYQYNSITKTVEIVVNPGATTTTLTSTPNPSYYGDTLNLTANVVIASGSGTLSGWVVFTDQNHNNAVLGRSSLGGNTATLNNVSGLLVDRHTLVATYTDNTANFSGSSGSVDQTVNKLTPAFSNLSSPTIYVGTANTPLSGKILAGTYIPHGNISITVNGANQTVAIDAGGAFTATFNTGAFGVNTYPITYAFAGDTNSSGISDNTRTLTVNDKVTPVITWNNPAAITYGTALSSTQLNATATYNGATVAGTFTYTPAAGTILNAGTQTLSVTFNPTDGSQYYGNSAQVSLVVNPANTATALASDNNPSTYGQTVNFTATVSAPAGVILSGSVKFTDQTTTLGTIPLSGNTATLSINTLSTGSHTVAAQYTDITRNINGSSSAPLTQTVGMLTPGFSNLSSPTITYGAASAAISGKITSGAYIPTGSVTINLNGTAQDVPINQSNGAFAATFNSSTLMAGTYTVNYSYPGDANSSSATGSSNLTVNPVQPVISWNTPAAITYGAALSGLQLNAGTTISGTYVYSPAAGTVLSAGTQTLSVTFTPSDTVDYTTASGSVKLTVNKAPLTVTADNKTMTAGGTVPALTYTITGFVNGDTASAVTGSPVLATTATASSPAGTYPITITAGSLASANYSFTNLVAGNLTVTPASTTNTLTVVQVGCGGTITPAPGTYNNYSAGSTVNLTAKASYGWQFQGWTATAGVTINNPSNAISSFVMPGQPVTVTATFVKVYTVTASVGSSCSWTWDKDKDCYHRTDSDSNNSNSGKDDDRDHDNWNYSRNNWNNTKYGNSSFGWGGNYNQTSRYTGSSGHGTVSPATQTVASGANASPIIITPDSGYAIYKVMDNNVSVSLTQVTGSNPYSYRISNVTANHKVVVTFKASQPAPKTYTVTASIGGSDWKYTIKDGKCYGYGQGNTWGNNGSKYWSWDKNNPGGWWGNGNGYGNSGWDNDDHNSNWNNWNNHGGQNTGSSGHGTVIPATQTVASGANATITIKPDAGYVISQIVDNNQLVTPTTSYVIKDVTANHNVVVTFKPAPPVKIDTVTTLTVPSMPITAGQSVTLKAVVSPVSSSNNKPSGYVKFYYGDDYLGQSQLNSSATASLSVTLDGSHNTIKAVYGGDTNFNGSQATASITVYQQSCFVIWGGNSHPLSIGDKCTFWSSQWAKQVTAGSYYANPSFKGYASKIGSSGSSWSWSTSTGNSSNPPGSIGPCIQVIVSTQISKSSSGIKGDIARYAIVQVDSGYQGNPGHDGTGTIVALMSK